MSSVVKFIAQLCLSKQGRKLLATTLLIILSPIILAFILVLSLAEGTQQHNNHMIDASFNDAPIGTNTPVEFVKFIENYQYAFEKIDNEVDLVKSEVNGFIDNNFIKAILYVSYIDQNSNNAIRNIDYKKFVEAFIREEVTEVIAPDTPEDSEIEYITTKFVIIDRLTCLSNVVAITGIPIDSSKDDIIIEIYSRVNFGMDGDFDEYRPIIQMLQQAMIDSALTPFIGGVFTSPFADGFEDDVTSEFGKRTPVTLPDGTVITQTHTGLDIGKPASTQILAVASGKVVLVCNMEIGFGLHTVIDHGGNVFSIYAHTSRLLVTEGQEVNQGDVIAEVGSTGYSTGNHLHLEVLEDGKSVNPRNYLK